MDEREQIIEELGKELKKEFRKQVDMIAETSNSMRIASDSMFQELESLEGKTDVESKIRSLELAVGITMMETVSTTSQIMKSLDITLERMDSISQMIAKLNDRIADTSKDDKAIKDEIKHIKSELDSTKQKVVDTLVPIKEGYDRLKDLNNRKINYIG